MSKRETPMTRWYWQQIGGTLIEEFCAVSRSKTTGVRLLDGVIIPGGVHRIARQNEVNVAGEDIVVVQTKASRLGMYIMGQTLFSARLMKQFEPRSIESVALVSKTMKFSGRCWKNFQECESWLHRLKPCTQ